MKKFFKKVGKACMKVLSSIGRFFKRAFSPIYRYFCRRYAGLKTLVMMQLKDKLNFSFKADKKGALTKLILFILMFAIVTAIIAVIFYLMNLLSVFGHTQDVPISVFNLVFIAMLVLSTLSCIVQLTNSLFFSRDNLVLLSYPVRANVVFLSKLVVFYVIELIKEVMFVVPMFLAYGIIFRFSFIYFPWVIVMFFIIAMIPVAIASVVSIPYMFVKMFLTKRPLLQDIFFLVVLIVITVLVFIVINMIPENLHFLTRWSTAISDNQKAYREYLLDFANDLEVWMKPIYYVSALVMGATQNIDSPRNIMSVFNSASPIILIAVIGTLALLFVLAYLLAKPLFFKIAVKPFEYNKKVIFHNFSRNKTRVKSYSYSDAFVPVLNKEYKGKDLLDLRNKFEKALNEIVKQGDLFENDKINNKKICRLLKKQSGIDFVVVSSEEFVDQYHIGFFVEYRNHIPSLVLAKHVGISYVDCYDPNYLKKQNLTKTAFFSSMWKDILMDIRTPGKLVGNYILLVITPVAIALLNKLFASINTNFLGVTLTIIFNILIITLIPLSSNVMFASIYSREGESAYLLKAAPANYMKTLTAKLVLRAILMTVSILITCILYRYYASDFTRTFIKPLWLFFAVTGLYLGHLIWSAELDFMNPQDALYRETGEGNISNSNETTSLILVYVITLAFTGISFFMINDNIIYSFYKIGLVGLAFLGCRILLFVLKIKGYRNSRGERGRD